ncbi:hypothetical protein SAMN05877838_2537 [Hoeflea halophila]|uniref:Uncharacterized protein n=1 Tax=Hoeflea halophila TaxID=714899 RepID=A0A286IEC4_9HYPH|nr:hypothetical protein [Hoeflea halophila]SOE17634.1 hypothetical protein SAMN05877838_2537 [Hoeflea halophila]
MAADTQPMPMQGLPRPAPEHRTAQAHSSSRLQKEHTPARTTPLALELVELELALDLSDIADRGFSDAVRDAAREIGGEYLFDLPASGLVEDAQRIAVVCLSRDQGGRFGLVLLSSNGDRVEAVEADESTLGLVQFARAFVSVLEKL